VILLDEDTLVLIFLAGSGWVWGFKSHQGNVRNGSIMKALLALVLVFFGLFGGITPIFALPPVTADLEGYWPLDGNADDQSGNGWHGTIQGATSTSGLFGGAFSFNGTANIQIPIFDFYPTGEYTVNSWIRTSQPAEPSMWRNWLSMLDPALGGPLELYLGDGSTENGQNGAAFSTWDHGIQQNILYANTPNLRDNQWHMVTATFKPGSAKIYVDGILRQTLTTTDALPPASSDLFIGGRDFGDHVFHKPFIGSVDDVAIYSRALTADEVNLLFGGLAHVLFVTANGASSLSAYDAAMVERLQSLGFSVALRADELSASTDANGKHLVVISSSVDSSQVKAKFRNVTVPVIVMENAIYDDMKMTGTTNGTHYGSDSGETKIKMSDIKHPLAVGLTGTVTTTTATRNYSWGVPSSGGKKIARLFSNSGRATVFVYEQGATMFGMTAPARRAGFFMQSTGSDASTPETWEMFDAIVDWSVRVTPALFVVSNPNSLSAGDKLVLGRLRQLGFNVTLQDDNVVTSSDAIGKQVVLISDSVAAGNVNTKFLNTTIPVVSCENFLWDDLQMTTSSNIGTASSQTQQNITFVGHPLAARRSGLVSITTSGKNYFWGRPAPTALKISQQATDSTRDMVFAYDKGAPLINGTPAAGKRVGLFIDDASVSTFTASAWALFDAAMRWSLEVFPPQVQQVTISPQAGGYAGDVVITMATATPLATIRFTTDGSTPTPSSPIYAGAFTITPPKTVKAFAVRQGFSASIVTTAEYISTSTSVAPVTFDPPAGGYAGTINVTLSTATLGATIRYTTNGSNPTASSPVYSGPISVTPPRTVKAFATKAGLVDSPITSAAYTAAERVDTPSISPGGGVIQPNTQCSIFVGTPGATIYFTTDASPATTSSTVYTGPFLVNPGQTVRAIATAPGYVQSFEGFAFY
jgi:hypothetical protein